jgi:hypothetical protein
VKEIEAHRGLIASHRRSSAGADYADYADNNTGSDKLTDKLLSYPAEAGLGLG